MATAIVKPSNMVVLEVHLSRVEASMLMDVLRNAAGATEPQLAQHVRSIVFEALHKEIEK